jgi:hypothetical protein
MLDSLQAVTIFLNGPYFPFTILQTVEFQHVNTGSMHTVWGCTPDEDTYSILAAGLVMAGEHEKAGALLLTAGSRGYDSRKIDLHEIVLSWKQGRWRQVLHRLILCSLFGIMEVSLEVVRVCVYRPRALRSNCLP